TDLQAQAAVELPGTGRQLDDFTGPGLDQLRLQLALKVLAGRWRRLALAAGSQHKRQGEEKGHGHTHGRAPICRYCFGTLVPKQRQANPAPAATRRSACTATGEATD